MSVEDIGDGIFIKLHSQFQQFTFDLAVAPISVLSSEANHQVLGFLFGTRSSSLLALIGPFSLDQCAMPSDHGSWLKDPQTIS